MQFAPLIEDNTFLRHFWHPVCTAKELEESNPSGIGPLGVTLLNERVVIARIDEELVALQDRCPHRSAMLSKGRVTAGQIACPYHGWAFGADGVCKSIPACPDKQIPSKARVTNYACQEKYGLVWVRLDSSFDCTDIPYFSAADDPEMKTVILEPYWWKTSAARRWENFTDFSHFAFVHPNTLFDPTASQPPVVPVDRVNGALCFKYDTPKGMDIDAKAVTGVFNYVCTMPFTINLSSLKHSDGTTNVLFTVSCPINDHESKSFLVFSREKKLGDRDFPHIAFRDLVFNEDKPIIESEWPPYIPKDELSVVTDKISVQYRKWLRELSVAALNGKDAFKAALHTPVVESNRD